MQFDTTVNIPTILALGTILIGLFKVYRGYVRMEFKVEQLWNAHEAKHKTIVITPSNHE